MRATPLGLFLIAPTLLAAANLPTNLFAGSDPAVDQPQPLQSTEAMGQLQRAFWLEEHEGDLEHARELYLQAAEDGALSTEERIEAGKRAEAISQDLLARDLTVVLPPDAILYAELSEPGENLGALLSQLGLLGRASQTGRFGISPDLVQGLLGIEGAALAVTAFSAGGGGLPSGVLVLHPGDLSALRGLMVSTLSAKGLPAAAIEGYATWAVPIEPGFEVLVTLTERLVIASNDVFEIGAVIERMRGDDDDTLANNEDLQVALRPRQGALLSVCVNAQPIMPLLRSLAAEESKRDPDLSLALALVDLPSLQSIGAFVTAGEEGLGLEVELGLREGHRNLIFDSLRLPNVQRETLALVPEGAAFALATALNSQADVAPLGTDSVGRPIVTLLDVGRELFANVIDVALFGLSSGGAGGELPEVALVIRSNDAQRTAAMLELVLGLATQVTSQAASSDPPAMGETARGETIAGVEASRFMVAGVPLFLVAEADRVVLSPSRAALARSIDAASGRGSLLSDPHFAREVQAIDGTDTMLLLAAPGRLAEMALPFVSHHDRRQLEPVGELLCRSVLSARLVHDDTRLGIHFRLGNLPDVSELVARALRGEDPLGRLGSQAANRTASAGQTIPAPNFGDLLHSGAR